EVEGELVLRVKDDLPLLGGFERVVGLGVRDADGEVRLAVEQVGELLHVAEEVGLLGLAAGEEPVAEVTVLRPFAENQLARLADHGRGIDLRRRRINDRRGRIDVRRRRVNIRRGLRLTAWLWWDRNGLRHFEL